MSDPAKEFKDALGGDVVLPGVDRPGGLSATEVLATRSWFDKRRKRLTSSGGRPTDPDWTMRRLIPMAVSTWEHLEALAERWSGIERQVGPGQVAAFLLEDAVLIAVGRATRSGDRAPAQAEARETLEMMYEPVENLEARFRDWKRPTPFFSSVA